MYSLLSHTSKKLRPCFLAKRMPSIMETSRCFADMSDLLPIRIISEREIQREGGKGEGAERSIPNRGA